MQRKPKNSTQFILLSCILISAIAYFAYPDRLADTPDVTIKTITNKTISLKQLHGKPVLISFWASNCPSCLKEIAHFKSLYTAYHAKPGLEIIAIAMYYDRPNYVVNTVKDYQIPYAIALDLDQQLAKAFGDVNLTPTTFLINPEGKIAFQTTGVFDLKKMQRRIESM